MIKNEITAVNKDNIKPRKKMYQFGPALSKLVNCYFYVDPCTAAAQEIRGHEACTSQKVCGQSCLAAWAPNSHEQRGKVREHGGVKWCYCSLQIPQAIISLKHLHVYKTHRNINQGK